MVIVAKLLQMWQRQKKSGSETDTALIRKVFLSAARFFGRHGRAEEAAAKIRGGRGAGARGIAVSFPVGLKLKNYPENCYRNLRDFFTVQFSGYSSLQAIPFRVIPLFSSA